MKVLNGRDVADFIQERHARQVRALHPAPVLAIVRQGDDAATSRYLEVKQRYGAAIGVEVRVYTETAATLLQRIKALNADKTVTGIIIQLPLVDTDLTGQAVAAVAPAKDVDGLGPDSPFDTATPKAILWLLAAYNVDLKARHIAVVGQGRLVGKPLADMLEASGCQVTRADVHTADIGTAVRAAGLIITATGQAGLITSDMVQEGAVVVDAGAPASDLHEDVRRRQDLTLTPNPGGVGPMTVAALFDNVLIAAQQHGHQKTGA
jgi:methylenetetrahydrofolate dehydrogenase (NADP+)/methenyltetrahydrofolate cyclohydrolase